MTVLQRVADAVDALARSRSRVLVGVDGPDAAGKTVFAGALADRIAAPVVRASVDGFHHPSDVRRRRGSLSPEGYYRDAFDEVSVVRDLLEPFAAGAERVCTSTFDGRADAPAAQHVAVPAGSAVLVVDGVFLHRPGLRHWWTVSVYLHVPPEVTLQRALVRDLEVFGSSQEVERRYTARYLPGQALYRAEADPERAVDVLIDNTDPQRPEVLRWSLADAPT